ncbi:MAG: hypothetical protein PWQ59_1894 [Thermoanaerobacterium sp.]|nr:hypothetical protein [Thermoanaerobacterium sp.]MDN5317907.1 hypothetical protein [Thermoanaerobacterium sp.]
MLSLIPKICELAFSVILCYLFRLFFLSALVMIAKKIFANFGIFREIRRAVKNNS